MVQRDTVLIEHIWEFDNIPPSKGISTNEPHYSTMNLTLKLKTITCIKQRHTPILHAKLCQ
jgi:hypothetical protein